MAGRLLLLLALVCGFRSLHGKNCSATACGCASGDGAVTVDLTAIDSLLSQRK